METSPTTNECPDCAGSNVTYDNLREQLICRDCGLIFEPYVALEEEGVRTAKKPQKKAKPVKRKAARPKKKRR